MSVRKGVKPMPQAAYIMVADEQAKESRVSDDATAVPLTDMQQKIKVRKNNIAIIRKRN